MRIKLDMREVFHLALDGSETIVRPVFPQPVRVLPENEYSDLMWRSRNTRLYDKPLAITPFHEAPQDYLRLAYGVEPGAVIEGRQSTHMMKSRVPLVLVSCRVTLLHNLKFAENTYEYQRPRRGWPKAARNPWVLSMRIDLQPLHAAEARRGFDDGPKLSWPSKFPIVVEDPINTYTSTVAKGRFNIVTQPMAVATNMSTRPMVSLWPPFTVIGNSITVAKTKMVNGVAVRDLWDDEEGT